MITLEKFFDSKEKLAIHCDNLSYANILLKYFNKLGKKWNDGKSYLEDNQWDKYKSDTCYSNDGTYTSKDSYEYKVYGFEEVILEENNINTIFKMLNVEPNKKFGIKYGNIFLGNYYINEKLSVYQEKDGVRSLDSTSTLIGLINGEYEIIKTSKAIRDLTEEEFEKWKNKMCSKYDSCKGCPFSTAMCNFSHDGYWFNHKDLFSNKFLNQYVEIEEEE